VPVLGLWGFLLFLGVLDDFLVLLSLDAPIWLKCWPKQQWVVIDRRGGGQAEGCVPHGKMDLIILQTRLSLAEGYLRSAIAKIAISAGVIPEIRVACPIVVGRILLRWFRASALRPGTFS